MKKAYFKEFLLVSSRFFALAGIFIFLVPCLMDAQSQNVQFKHLTTNDGLSQSWVHTVIQDKYGFMWMGTEDGLNRYDGHSFRIYKNNFRDPYSISNNGALTLFENSKGDLWIGTRKGLNLYDRNNDRFIRYPRWPDRITSIAEDKNKILWVGMETGLYSLDLKNDSIHTYGSPGDLSRNSMSRMVGGQILKVFVDSRNNVWIGSSNGLHVYVREDNSFINYYQDEKNPNSISSDVIRSILEDDAGRLWIGTSAGLDLFVNNQEHSPKGRFIHYKNIDDDKTSISKGPVLALFEDDKRNLWIGVQNGGLDILNLETYNEDNTTFNHYKNDPNKENSLSNNSIYSITQDFQGNIWVSTFGKGLNIINPSGDRFVHYKSESGSKNSLSNNQVNTFLEDNNYLWIGTEGGLNLYNKKDATFKHYVHDPLNKRSIGSNAVWAICKDKKGNLWVGTWGGGLNKFDYKTETFEHFYNNPDDTNSISSNNMFAIFEDRKENLWIGTMGGGLNMYDYKKNRFVRYTPSNSNLYTNYVPAIIESKSGDLWLSNESSFERFNIKTKEFENFSHSDNDSTSLSSTKAISIYEDSKGNLWMGTDAGLNLFNKTTKGFTCYRIEDGLPDNAITGIVEDKKGNLWLSTDKGLSKLINAINFPAKPEFRNYGYEDGLQGNEFCPRSCYKGADGKLYFGGPNGFNVFDPDKIIENTYIPPIVISGFNIFNKPQLLGERGLNKNLDSTEDIVLSYKQSVFSFEFAALNYTSSFKNQYAYKMEGFDKDWNYIGTKNSASYTNLDPGKYIFRVKGSNNDGVWNEKGVALPIVITPPYWLSLWFRLLLVVVAGGIIFWIYQWRLQARDLAAQKRMESAVTKERNLLRTLIDLIPDYIYLKDTESRFILANNGLLKSFGKETIDEIHGKTDFDFHPLENAREYFAEEQEIIRSGKPLFSKEELVVEASGYRKWNITTKLPFRDPQGNVVGLVGIGRDNTERKLFEEALSQKTALLEAQLNSSIDGILVVDNEGRKILQNQKIVELWKIPQEIAENPDDEMQVAHIMHTTKDPDQFVAQVKYLYSHPNETSQDEIELKDGMVLDRYSAPVIGSDGRNYGRIWSFRNITERKQAEGEREQLIKELQNAVADIKVLSGLVPICSSCKKIRDDKGYWTQLEGYIQAHSQAKFSHGVCPDCMKKLYPNFIPKKAES